MMGKRKLSRTKEQITKDNQLVMRLLSYVQRYHPKTKVHFLSPTKSEIVADYNLALGGLVAAGNLEFGPFVKLFDLNKEGNIPTFYQASTLLLCSALLAIIAFAKKKEDAPYRLHWKALSIIFLFLSLDEAARLHERTIEPLQSALNASGFLHYAWIILGAVFVLIFVLAYLRFLADLPRKSRNLFLVAGAISVGGALGMESISGYHKSFYVGQYMLLSCLCNYHANHVMISTVEELLEMLGIVVFIYALMSYISLHVKIELTLIE